MERILCAAIWYNDGKKHVHQPINIETGFVICGRRHHNCIGIADIFGLKITRKDVQGFLTSKDRFVDRKEAVPIARSADQIIEPHLQKSIDDEILFSEDLY